MREKKKLDPVELAALPTGAYRAEFRTRAVIPGGAGPCGAAADPPSLKLPPPDSYWCGEAEAFGGSKRARSGLCRVMGRPVDSWEQRAARTLTTGAEWCRTSANNARHSSSRSGKFQARRINYQAALFSSRMVVRCWRNRRWSHEMPVSALNLGAQLRRGDWLPSRPGAEGSVGSGSRSVAASSRARWASIRVKKQSTTFCRGSCRAVGRE